MFVFCKFLWAYLFYFVNLSDFMVLVAKKIKENFSFLIFWASLVGEEK